MLQEMNIMTCELTSLFLLARKIQTNHALSSGEGDKKRSHEMMEQDDTVPVWADRIVDYVLGLLGFDVRNGMGMDTCGMARLICVVVVVFFHRNWIPNPPRAP
jgi:hypothetical protein